MNLNDLPTKSFCILPWVSSAIGTDGFVSPCCLWVGKESKYAKEHNVTVPHAKDGLQSARNSKFFETIRQQMIDGEYPTGCKYCWEQESNKIFNKLVETGEASPQRVSRHAAHANPLKTKYKNTPEPMQFLETAISNVCNFACVMCSTEASSIIWGIYNPGKSIPKGFAESIDNLDEDFSHLTLVKIVGGEPMVEKKHDNLLDKIISQNKNPKNLIIEYHTNASVFPSQRVIDQWKKLKAVRIIFSMDSVGKYAELQRPGNYKWQDIEDTVDKYVQLSNTDVPIIFSANITLTALNIQYITETCDWLYNKLKNSETSWFNCNTINKQAYKYIDFRNLSKQTKQRIKNKWKDWESTNPAVLSYNSSDGNGGIRTIYKTAKESINEQGVLDEPLTKELMLKNHHHVKLWKSFKQDLGELDL